MTTPFIKITSDYGWIGRIGWWNTEDHASLFAGAPPEMMRMRIWGKAPIFTDGYGPRGAVDDKPKTYPVDWDVLA